MTDLHLKPQEIPVDDPASNCFFRPSPKNLFLATPTAIDACSIETIVCCFGRRRTAAVRRNEGIASSPRSNEPGAFFRCSQSTAACISGSSGRKWGATNKKLVS